MIQRRIIGIEWIEKAWCSTSGWYGFFPSVPMSWCPEYTYRAGDESLLREACTAMALTHSVWRLTTRCMGSGLTAPRPPPSR